MSSLIQPEIFFSALSPAEQRLQQALEDIRQGKPVLVMDDFDRENEADLIVAAETLTVETMAGMIRDRFPTIRQGIDTAAGWPLFPVH